MSRRVWKAVEIKAREVGMAEAEGGEKERRGRKEARREGTKERDRKEEEKTKERKNGEDSRRIGDLEQRRRSGKVWRGSKGVGARALS